MTPRSCTNTCICSTFWGPQYVAHCVDDSYNPSDFIPNVNLPALGNKTDKRRTSRDGDRLEPTNRCTTINHYYNIYICGYKGAVNRHLFNLILGLLFKSAFIWERSNYYSYSCNHILKLKLIKQMWTNYQTYKNNHISG